MAYVENRKHDTLTTSVTSRDIIRQTLDYDAPVRVAHSFPPSDMIEGHPVIDNPDGEWRKISDIEWRRTDEWGNIWARVDATSKGKVHKGVLDNLDEAATIPLPDFSNPACYRDAQKIFTDNPDLWHVGFIHGLTFSITRKLRRMEQYFMDLLLEPEKLRLLHDRVDEQIQNQMLGQQQAGADCVMFCEDWGTQAQTLINPELWREEFKPRFVRLCRYAHDLGLKVFMHSCGKITAIIPDLIEAGVDLLQFDQPTLHGIDNLRDLQKQGKITFWCPIDIQRTLQTKNEALIRQEAAELIEKLWSTHGGFIAGYYTDNPSIGLEPIWQEIASDEFSKRGVR